jgi:ATP-dependent protease ClpP protease subunit
VQSFILATLFHLPLLGMPIHVKAPAASIDVSTAKIATITERVSPDTARKFDMEYAVTQHLPGDRLVLIDSPGGDVAAGNDMIRTMETEKGLGIRQVCVVFHSASSMAFNFLTHCDVRLALPKASMLMHKIATGGIDCVSTRCTAKYLRNYATDLDEVDEPFRQANAKALGMTLKDYDLFCEQEHIWTTETLLARHYLQGVAALFSE